MHQEHFETLGTIVKGHLTFRDLQDLAAAMHRFADGDVVITVAPVRARRTLAQNNFWRAVVVPAFAEHTGYDRDDMHDVLCLRLIPKTIVDLETGEERIVPGRTSTLSVKDFSDLIERAQRLGAEMDIFIPDAVSA